MMGFPDSYVFPVSETQAMKQLGNVVVVPAISAVANEIINSLKIYDSRKKTKTSQGEIKENGVNFILLLKYYAIKNCSLVTRT